MEEKAKISAIKRFAVHDGPGIRTTAFFKGCPLHCRWCHNPEGINPQKQLAFFVNKCVLCGSCASVCPVSAHEIVNGKHIFRREKCVFCEKCVDVCPVEALVLYGKEYAPSELAAELVADKPFYKASGGGITVSGGEPLLHADYLVRLFEILKKDDIDIAVDTCGCVARENIDAVLPYADIFLYDIKHIDSQKHKEGTGMGNELILENLKYLDAVGAKAEIRYPFIPGFNSDENTLRAVAGFLSKLKCVTGIRVLPYHNMAGSKYEALGLKNNLPAQLPTDESVAAAKNIFAEYGINVLK